MRVGKQCITLCEGASASLLASTLIAHLFDVGVHRCVATRRRYITPHHLTLRYSDKTKAPPRLEAVRGFVVSCGMWPREASSLLMSRHCSVHDGHLAKLIETMKGQRGYIMDQVFFFLTVSKLQFLLEMGRCW